ncbi:MAG: TIM barrel protein [Christensenellales bacterium]|jgi:sugar phosphate isomerase/epimerase
MIDPKVYLAIDNCYAYKRWTLPRDWMEKSLECGYRYIEASADTEADPLYMGADYMRDWVKTVRAESARTGAKVANLYSGHGTYTTLGLAHPDARIRRRFLDEWFKPMVDAAAGVGAGLGYFAHGFMNPEIQSAQSYARKVDELYDSLAEIARHAQQSGVEYVSVENMYTPHMYPWTIQSAADTLRQAYARAGYPTYLSIDVGHMAGQARFMRPTRDALEKHAGTRGNIWVGTSRAHDLLQRGEIDAVLDDIAQNPQLFADGAEDGDPYAWLSRFGCYSPIIHMQQTDNTASAHRPFTPQYNKTGIIDIKKVLRAIQESYDAPEMPGMPPRCRDIYITVEVFCGTMDSPYALLESLTQTAQYMRTGIPEDGLTLRALTQEDFEP